MNLLDKPIININSFHNLRSILDSLQVKKINEPSKVYVINYWATWCGPCIEEMNSFELIINRNINANIEFIFISDEPIKRQIDFVQKKKWTFSFYKFDSAEYKLTQIYPRKWPTTLVVKNDIVYLKVEQKYNWDSELFQTFLNGLLK